MLILVHGILMILLLLFYFQYQLRKASMTEIDAFAFLKGDNQGDFITYSGFLEALRQVLFIRELKL